MENSITGDYGAVYKGSRQVGGFFYWAKVFKPNVGYSTSDWWLFEPTNECEIFLYEAVGDELKLVQQKERVKLKCSHKVKLDYRNKGLVIFQVI